MVTTPKQILETILITERPILTRLESAIDKELMQRYNGACEVWIGADGFKELREPTIKHFLDKYRQAGWSIRHHHADQPDGDSYVFSAQRKEPSDSDQASSQAYSLGGPRPYE